MLYECLIQIQEQFGGDTIEQATQKASLSNNPGENAKTKVLSQRFLRHNIKLIKEELDEPNKNIGTKKSAGSGSKKNV